MISDYEQWKEKRRAVKEENERLIKQWSSVPWWQFWKRPPFEEQRRIIIENWERLR